MSWEPRQTRKLFTHHHHRILPLLFKYQLIKSTTYPYCVVELKYKAAKIIRFFFSLAFSWARKSIIHHLCMNVWGENTSSIYSKELRNIKQKCIRTCWVYYMWNVNQSGGRLLYSSVVCAEYTKWTNIYHCGYRNIRVSWSKSTTQMYTQKIIYWKSFRL